MAHRTSTVAWCGCWCKCTDGWRKLLNFVSPMRASVWALTSSCEMSHPSVLNIECKCQPVCHLCTGLFLKQPGTTGALRRARPFWSDDGGKLHMPAVFIGEKGMCPLTSQQNVNRHLFFLRRRPLRWQGRIYIVKDHSCESSALIETATGALCLLKMDFLGTDDISGSVISPPKNGSHMCQTCAVSVVKKLKQSLFLSLFY